MDGYYLKNTSNFQKFNIECSSCHPQQCCYTFLIPFNRCYVLSMTDGKLDLSLRASRTGCVVESDDGNKEEDKVTDPEVESLGDLTKGQVLRGYVKAVTDVGVFVR